jgi:hypothetical protein
MANPAFVWADPNPLIADSHHDITAVAVEHGWISPSGVVAVAHGTSTNFVIDPEPYYHVSDVVVDTTSIGPTNSYVFTEVTSNRMIEAFFAENLTCMDTPEWWLASHGLTNDTFCNEAMADADEDGMFAWEEWPADTDPTNASSVLAITGIREGQHGMWLTWKGGLQARQVLEYRDGVGSTGEQWLAVFSNGPPTALSTDFLDKGATNHTRFYRIRAQR